MDLIYNNPAMSMRDIHFPNDSISYIVGNIGKVFKTIDGGNTWQDFTSLGSLSGNLTSVYFLNSDTGFVGKTSSAAMFKTVNGGLTWNQAFGYVGQGCFTIKFLNDTLGYAGSFNTLMYRTTNAGNTWAQQNILQTSEEITSIDFANLITGIAVSAGYILRTNNGVNWSSVFVSGSNFISTAISPQGSIIIGDQYAGLRTASNFGTTYTNSNSLSGLQDFRRINFFDAQNGWVAGDEQNVYKINNGGATWTNVNNTNYVEPANDMAVISANKIVIATGYGNGKVDTTANGGATFTEQILRATNELKAISFPSATNGYVVGNNGTAFKISNGGTRYIAMNTGFTNNITEVFFVTNQLGFVESEWGEFKKTINSGSTWTSLNVSSMGTTKQIYFTDIANGYTINENGAVFRTIDGGTTFLRAGQTCLQTLLDMQFINDSTGFVVGSFVNATCDVSYTTNYENTWQSINFPYAYSGWGVCAFDTANVFIVGQSQTIIKSGVDGVITKAINLDKNNDDNFKIYPNPSNGIFQIETSNKINNLQIINLQGELIFNENNLDNNAQLSLTNIAAGIYFIHIVSNNKTS